MSYPNGDSHAGNEENATNGAPPSTLSDLARQHPFDKECSAYGGGNQQLAPSSYSFQQMTPQPFNPNAAPFRPRYNQPSDYVGGQPPQPTQQAPATGYPNNLVSTLHSSPHYQQYQQPYRPQPEQTQPIMKSYAALNGPAQQPPQYFGGFPQMNGLPPPPPTSMQVTGVGTFGTVDANQSVATSHHQSFNFSQQLMERVQVSQNSFPLLEIQIALEQIINEPQEFETWASAIRSKLISSDFTEDDLSLTAALIIEMAITVAGSQYNFSRLCQHLDQTIGDFVLHYLLPQMSHLSTYTSEERQSYVLFLAELYDKLSGSNAPRSGDAGNTNSSRKHLSKLISQQLSATLETAVDDSLLKTVVRVLKLAGRLLEADFGAEWMDKLFGALNALCSVEDGKLSESAKCHVLSLNQLRLNSWGVTKIEPTAGVSMAHPPSSSLSSSILIVGPDGKPLSEEEVRFLDEQMGNSTANGSGGSPSKNSWNDPIMDDEVMDEYEKFLQDTAMRAAEKALERVSIDDDEDAGPMPEAGKK